MSGECAMKSLNTACNIRLFSDDAQNRSISTGIFVDDKMLVSGTLARHRIFTFALSPRSLRTAISNYLEHNQSGHIYKLVLHCLQVFETHL